MTRAELIKLAAEVGAYRYTNRHLPGEPSHAFSIEMLERFAALVAQAERDACAQVCEQQNVSSLTIDVLQGSRHGIQDAATRSCGEHLAARIRARGTTGGASHG